MLTDILPYSKTKEYKRRWYHAHRQEELERRRTRRDEIYRKHKQMIRELRDAIFRQFGERCRYCNFTDRRALQIDHINGGGHQERKKLGEYQMYKRVIQYPNEYQILCANCNWIKRYENDEHSPA